MDEIKKNLSFQIKACTQLNINILITKIILLLGRNHVFKNKKTWQCVESKL